MGPDANDRTILGMPAKNEQGVAMGPTGSDQPSGKLLMTWPRMGRRDGRTCSTGLPGLASPPWPFLADGHAPTSRTAAAL